VRLEGVRALAAAQRDASRCARLLTLATDDPDTAVRLVALDGLDRPCPDPGSQTRLLASVAASLPSAPSGAWHEAVHALASLAAVAPRRAEPLLGRFAGYPDPFVRTWAARVAPAVDDGALLRDLTRDVDANVRAAALAGLGGMAGPAADSLLITALARDDAPQVILAVAPRLHAVTDPRRREGALAAALETLHRLSRKGAETSRDPRLALLEVVEALGDTTTVDAVEPYLRDFDPAVARRAAAALERWTGKRYLAAPRSAPRLPLPSAGQLRAMERATLVLHMLQGGDVEIRLWPWVAPTNAFRLYEMVRTHALDGLTFHRVVPNFVVQGGSPGANEYAGHGAFTRDEVGLPVQWRGTVGVSTRGRDTGDGQIYVNLVDNVRLDHDYTILGEVVSGMDVVDVILEGDVIRGTDVRMEP
jgi:cyclophilin family peptidyl-prolyl cis-trans isomerase/HEAT repeat protein